MSNGNIRSQAGFDHGRGDAFGEDVVQPYQLMPVQMQGRPKVPCSDWVRLLMVAVLEDAMRVFLSPVGGVLRRRDQVRARQWFMSPDVSYVFAFERICEVLDFDAPRLRAKLWAQLQTTNTRRADRPAERAVA